MADIFQPCVWNLALIFLKQDGFVVPAWVAQPDGAPRGAVVVL